MTTEAQQTQQHDLDAISLRVRTWINCVNAERNYCPGGAVYGIFNQNCLGPTMGYIEECFGNLGHYACNCIQNNCKQYYAVIPQVPDQMPLEVLKAKEFYRDLHTRDLSRRPLLDASPDSPYREVIDFVLQYDPWQIKPYLVCTDPQWIQENGWVFIDFKDLPVDQVYGFSMFACRFLKTDFLRISRWRLFKETMDPRKAMLLSMFGRPADTVKAMASSVAEVWKQHHMTVSGTSWLEGLVCNYAYRFMSSQPLQNKDRGPWAAPDPVSPWYRPRASYIFSTRNIWMDKINTDLLSHGGTVAEMSDFLDECYKVQKEVS